MLVKWSHWKNMLIDKVGIKCDLTGEVLKDDFFYYSVSGKKINVSGDKITPHKEVAIDLDISEIAFKSILEKCKPHIGFMGKNSIKCELSGKVLSGEFEYYNLVFDKIEVLYSKADKETGDVPIEVMNGVLDLNIDSQEALRLLETKNKWRAVNTPS